MKLQAHFVFCILVLFSGLTACKKQAPQLPSNKYVVVDSASASLLTINKDLTLKEDSLLALYVKSGNEAFKKSEIGFWYKIDDSGHGLSIENKTTCNISYRLSDLNGKLFEKSKSTVVIGKKKIVTGFEEGLKLLHKGDSATFIIPWYLGYGMKGNENIPPYTSLRYEVRISK
jgi:FKBP-type peptidyl-prolyl cis-trans isomerase